MSENLKRAESLFNRIMNQNGGGAATTSGASAPPAAAAKPPPVELPKRDPAKIAHDTLARIPPAHHVLPFCWTVWFHLRTRKKDDSGQPAVDLYLQRTEEILFPVVKGEGAGALVVIGLVEQMWMAMACLKRGHDLVIGTELLVFKAGIAPVWEDPVNTKGGRWVFRFNRRSQSGGDSPDGDASLSAHQLAIRRRTNLIWERLLLRTLTGLLIPDTVDADVAEALLSDICGVVLSVRKDDDIISVWNLNLNFKKKDKLLLFQGRRMICDAILRVIRECDLIAQGLDCVDTVDLGLNERVFGVLFEYRLHADNPHDAPTNKYRRYHHQNHT